MSLCSAPPPKTQRVSTQHSAPDSRRNDAPRRANQEGRPGKPRARCAARPRTRTICSLGSAQDRVPGRTRFPVTLESSDPSDAAPGRRAGRKIARAARSICRGARRRRRATMARRTRRGGRDRSVGSGGGRRRRAPRPGRKQGLALESNARRFADSVGLLPPTHPLSSALPLRKPMHTPPWSIYRNVAPKEALKARGGGGSGKTWGERANEKKRAVGGEQRGLPLGSGLLSRFGQAAATSGEEGKGREEGRRCGASRATEMRAKKQKKGPGKRKRGQGEQGDQGVKVTTMLELGLVGATEDPRDLAGSRGSAGAMKVHEWRTERGTKPMEG